MKVIKLSVLAASDDEVVSGTLSIQRKRGDSWTVEEVITVVSGKPGSERTLLLDDTQRLVVEGTSNVELVFDRAQAAAVPRPNGRPPLVPTPLSSDGEESDTPAIAEAALRGVGIAEQMAQERRDAAITVAREKLKTAAQAQLQPPKLVSGSALVKPRVELK